MERKGATVLGGPSNPGPQTVHRETRSQTDPTPEGMVRSDPSVPRHDLGRGTLHPERKGFG